MPPPRARRWGWGQGTTAFEGLSHHSRSRCQRGLETWSQTLLSTQHAKRETACSRMWWAEVKRVQDAAVGGRSTQGREVAPARCFPPPRAARQALAQIAFLKHGCFLNSLHLPHSAGEHEAQFLEKTI